MDYLSNAISINMINVGTGKRLSIAPCLPGDVPGDAVSYIGHPDVAAIAEKILQRDGLFNRDTLRMDAGDHLYVIQYIGGRLEAGATELPPDAELRFYKVCIEQ